MEWHEPSERLVETLNALERAAEMALRDLAQLERPAVERDLEDALQRQLSETDQLIVSRQGHLALESWQGGLGPVDLVLEYEDQKILLEVKWGAEALANCAWDVAKLATSLVEEQAQSALLVAGGREADWTGARGAELFRTRQWTAEGLLARYPDWFAFWREDVANYPRQLAKEWWIFEEGHARGELQGEEWSIRLARVVLEEAAELVPVAYAPQIAHWKREAQYFEPAESPEPGRKPDAYRRLSSLDEASEITGPLYAAAGGEGYSLRLGSAHYLAADEGTMRDFVDTTTAAELERHPARLHRFDAPSARRDYLMDQGLVEDPWPEVLEISCGAGLGDNSWLGLERNRLHYRYLGYRSEGAERDDLVVPQPVAWLRLWREFDRLGVWDWWPHYEPPWFSTDGYRWEVCIFKAGRMVVASGYEAWPERGRVAHQQSAEWADFQAAIRDLLDGREMA